MKKNKCGKAVAGWQRHRFYKHGNLSITAEMLYDTVRDVWADDTIPVEEKKKRMQAAEEAIDLMLAEWCRFPTPEDKEKTQSLSKIVLWMAGFDAMLNPNKKNNVGVNHV